MRYTTVIDISEFPALYRNIHCRLLYFHMCLKAGYHDDDRDIFRGSIRTLAVQSGLTLSATRHALAVLTASGLLVKVDIGWKVTKWVLTPSITARPKTRSEAAEKRRASSIIEDYTKTRQEDDERRQKEEKVQELRRRKWLEESDLENFIKEYEAIKRKADKKQESVKDKIYLGANLEKYKFALEQRDKATKKKTQ